MSCIHKDPETGWCKLHSDWSSPMPVIEYCIEGPCPDEKHPTNADRIRSMSDEDLAEWLVDANMCERVCIEEDYCGCDVCVNRVTDWLKQPVKED